MTLGNDVAKSAFFYETFWDATSVFSLTMNPDFIGKPWTMQLLMLIAHRKKRNL